MDLIFSLVLVDQATGGRQMRQLVRGWMDREARSSWLRACGTRVLGTLASRLDPRDRPESLIGTPTPKAPAA